MACDLINLVTGSHGTLLSELSVLSKDKLILSKCQTYPFSNANTKDNLTKHERAVHDLHNMAFEEVEKELKQGDGNLKCKMCGEEFKGPKAASRMKYHLGQNCKRFIGYQCDHCWKNFAHKYDLDVHIKIKHTASVPTFQCDFCDFKSVYKNSLNRHTRTTHKEGKTSFELQRKRFASPKYSESN